MAQVYYKRLSNQIDCGQFDAVLARLPESKRQQLLRRQPPVRYASLALYAFLDEIVVDNPSYPPLDKLCFDERGWPHWLESQCDRPAWLSLSHSRHWLAVALSLEGPVGVDVEEQRGQSAQRFSRYFCREELEWAGDDPQRFLQLWTAKEAAVKMNGVGLKSALQWHFNPQCGWLCNNGDLDFQVVFYWLGQKEALLAAVDQ